MLAATAIVAGIIAAMCSVPHSLVREAEAEGRAGRVSETQDSAMNEPQTRTDTANERIGQQAVDLAAARKQRDGLLEALVRCTDHFENSVAALPEWGVGREIIREARDAIEKAGG